MPGPYLTDRARTELALPTVLLHAYVAHPETRIVSGDDGIPKEGADPEVGARAHARLIRLMEAAIAQPFDGLPAGKAASLYRRAARDAFTVAGPYLDGESVPAIGATLWHLICDLGAEGLLDVIEGSPVHEALTSLREMIGYALETPEMDAKAAERSGLMIEGYQRLGFFRAANTQVAAE
jgi:hypothetical protein